MSRTTFFEVEVLDGRTRQQLCFLDKVEPHVTIGDIKRLFHKSYQQLYPARQDLKLDPKGKSLKDDAVLQNLPVGTTATMYFRDLGPQIGWTMVFLAEYIGPLFIYLLFYFRLPYIYSQQDAFTSSSNSVVTLACACHTCHYIKRLIETVFVHRFSHGTVPLRTTVRSCVYYWTFSAWLAFYINHPLYTPPSYGDMQVNYALAIFVLCEAGNFSIHVALNNLKAEGGPKCRKFPRPTKNPFTWLFFLVSCPNYTYEVGAWASFSVMTQCLPVALFTFFGLIQMTIWANGKHKAYTREFKDYPHLRMPIIPLLL
ncbi:very-long-chain enoyl-CoA reductase isoform X2 [Oncorhynchus mykiss]|uniref:very-long-chain enoyl-CoA reductase isoform X2 n=1 Tax=Oncorhynchus mykiss TaxID=8022 RepID=UPI001877A089|nr:very-long-chain enoyl-CoA reductase isoform X2 [Oncorhynchus mykiss]